MSDRLSLGPLPSTKTVRLTVTLNTALNAALEHYATLHSQTWREPVDGPSLIPASSSSSCAEIDGSTNGNGKVHGRQDKALSTSHRALDSCTSAAIPKRDVDDRAPRSSSRSAAMEDEHHAYFRVLGQYITCLRKLHGMKQADLAKAPNVSQQIVFAYELGDRRVMLPMAVKMARVFSISVDELAGATKPAHLARLRTSPAAAREMEQLKRLSKTQRRFVRRIVEVFLDRLEPPSAPKLQFQFPKVPAAPSRKRSADESATAASPSGPR